MEQGKKRTEDERGRYAAQFEKMHVRAAEIAGRLHDEKLRAAGEVFIKTVGSNPGQYSDSHDGAKLYTPSDGALTAISHYLEIPKVASRVAKALVTNHISVFEDGSNGYAHAGPMGRQCVVNTVMLFKDDPGMASAVAGGIALAVENMNHYKFLYKDDMETNGLEEFTALFRTKGMVRVLNALRGDTEAVEGFIGDVGSELLKITAMQKEHGISTVAAVGRMLAETDIGELIASYGDSPNAQRIIASTLALLPNGYIGEALQQERNKLLGYFRIKNMPDAVRVIEAAEKQHGGRLGTYDDIIESFSSLPHYGIKQRSMESFANIITAYSDIPIAGALMGKSLWGDLLNPAGMKRAEALLTSQQARDFVHGFHDAISVSCVAGQKAKFDTRNIHYDIISCMCNIAKKYDKDIVQEALGIVSSITFGDGNFGASAQNETQKGYRFTAGYIGAFMGIFGSVKGASERREVLDAVKGYISSPAHARLALTRIYGVSTESKAYLNLAAQLAKRLKDEPGRLEILDFMVLPRELIAKAAQSMKRGDLDIDRYVVASAYKMFGKETSAKKNEVIKAIMSDPKEAQSALDRVLAANAIPSDLLTAREKLSLAEAANFWSAANKINYLSIVSDNINRFAYRRAGPERVREELAKMAAGAMIPEAWRNMLAAKDIDDFRSRVRSMSVQEAASIYDLIFRPSAAANLEGFNVDIANRTTRVLGTLPLEGFHSSPITKHQAEELLTYGINGSIRDKALGDRMFAQLKSYVGDTNANIARNAWHGMRQPVLKELIAAHQLKDYESVASIFRNAAERLPEGRERAAFESILTMVDDAVLRGSISSGPAIVAYTVKDKGNIFNIDSAATACCTFMPYGVNSWGAFGYAADPAVVMVNFSVAGTQVGAKIENFKVHGAAIGALGRDYSGRRILYIDSLEGGDKFNKAMKGNENGLLGLLERFGREIGAEEVAIQTIARKWPGTDTPVEFTNALDVRKSRKKLGLQIDGPQYMECLNLQEQFNIAVNMADWGAAHGQRGFAGLLRDQSTAPFNSLEVALKFLRNGSPVQVKSVAIRKE